jgi:hypothetical protein
MLANLVASREALGVRRRCDVHEVASFRCLVARFFRSWL